MTAILGALLAALPLLACPQCDPPSGAVGTLAVVGPGIVGCASGHRFDVARQGHLTLLTRGARTDTGDTAAMLAARDGFLAAGHYRPIAIAVAEAAGDGPILEVGAGTGWYLAAVLDATPGASAAIALDASAAAARRIARRPGIAAIVADAWARWPVADGVIGTVLSVFAPRSAAEATRVVRPGGRLVAVTPEADHLSEIRSRLGMLAVDPGKAGRLEAAFADLLEPFDRRRVRFGIELDRDAAGALARMGPSAYHVHPTALDDRLKTLPDRVAVTVDVTVTALRKP